MRGFKFAFRKEQSFRIMLVVAFVVVLLMVFFPLHNIEKAILILSIGFVLGLEILNTQLEKILDITCPQYDERVKAIKDLSASAVLVAVLVSVLVGFFIFWPYIF